MTVTINASTSSGLQITSDTSGSIEFQSDGTTYNPLLTASTAQASTSGTAINFTGIPSWVKRITVMFSGVSTSGTSNILVQLGYSGGIESSGYNSGANNGGTGATSSAGFLFTQSTVAASTHYGSMIISTLGSNIWVMQSVEALGSGSVVFSAGGKTTTGTLDRLRITTVNGTDTFDAGTINIMYE